jgi:serine/threonine protein kinase
MTRRRNLVLVRPSRRMARMADENPVGGTDPRPLSTDQPTIAAETFDTEDDLVMPDAFTEATRYDIGAVLGKGGMGEVRLCTDRRIGRQVAMKVMRSDARIRPETRAQFLREARVQGQTEHPSIVPVYDVGVDDAGALFFTMRRVEGKTLEEVLRGLRNKTESVEREFSRHKLLTAFGSACLAVHFAHTRGIFHCDLKPANVMLGAFGELYVLDWGIATRGGARESAPRVADEEQRFVSGTPGYMAPEQIRGETLDARCDVYALGVLLYEILTLEPVHTGKSSRELRQATLDEKIERPSVRAPDRDVPPELDVICAKATARARAHRYASARELYDDLMGYLEGDRDLALRRALSREHTLRAASLAARAREGDESAETRSEALRTVSRALALDPDNPDALRTLVGLLTLPPKELPPEALEDMRATERSLDGPRARGGVMGLVLVAAVFPAACLVNGILSVPRFALTVAVGIVVAALGVLRVKRPRDDGFAPSYLPVSLSILIAVIGVCFNPTVMTPAFAIPFAVGYTLSMDPRRRFLPMIASSAAIIVPSALEWLHLISPSATMVGDLACVVPRTVVLPSLSGPLLVLGNVICVVGACYYALRFREILTETQRRVSVAAWQLRQLLPKDAIARTT